MKVFQSWLERIYNPKTNVYTKCEFEWAKVEYLGVIISYNSVEMDPVKVAGVVEWPIPNNKKEVQSFLGFINFYRWYGVNQCMHGYSDFSQLFQQFN